MTIVLYWKRPTPPQLSSWHKLVIDLIINNMLSQISQKEAESSSYTHYESLWFPARYIAENPGLWGSVLLADAILV